MSFISFKNVGGKKIVAYEMMELFKWIFLKTSMFYNFC